MKYAVVKIGGSQYKVHEGDIIKIDKLPLEEGKEIVFEEVLLLVDGSQVKIGQPFVYKAKVKAKVIAQEKGDKIRVARFRAKSRSRKVRGFRASLTRIKIEEMGEKSEKAEEKKVENKKPVKVTSPKVVRAKKVATSKKETK